MTKKVKYLSSIFAPVSLGELIDKITILEIKQIYMTGIKLKYEQPYEHPIYSPFLLGRQLSHLLQTSQVLLHQE